MTKGQPMTDSEARWQTALHEAGHVVAAVEILKTRATGVILPPRPRNPLSALSALPSGAGPSGATGLKRQIGRAHV